MNKSYIITYVIILSVGCHCYSQNFQSLYSKTLCGLNYTQASVLLGKKMAPYGYPYYGVDQPAPLVITDIPSSAKIEKAFVWWDIAGSDTSEKVILKNPNSIEDTFPGFLIGGNANMCWGQGYAFRADVTNIISGNGTYYISGLPTDTTFDFNNKSDVNGATIIIIYSDSHNFTKGSLIIYDGYEKVYNDTLLESISITSPSDTVTGKGFMILSDMQGVSGNSIKINNGPFLVPIQDFWDYEERATVFIPTQTTSVFGLRAPNDCYNLIMLGTFFQEPAEIQIPEITYGYGDDLISSSGLFYQWYLNDIVIANANSQTYLASQSGNYFVEVSDNYSCAFSSDTIPFIICSEKIKPNINFFPPDSLWTDSVNYILQWFFNGNQITGADLPYYSATETGSYWVQAQDSTGCSINSDIISVTIVGVDNFLVQDLKFEVVPNPNNGKFQISEILSDHKGLGHIIKKIEITDVLGKTIFSSAFPNSSSKIFIDVSFCYMGLYFLKIFSEENVSIMKFVVE